MFSHIRDDKYIYLTFSNRIKVNYLYYTVILLEQSAFTTNNLVT